MLQALVFDDFSFPMANTPPATVGQTSPRPAQTAAELRVEAWQEEQRGRVDSAVALLARASAAKPDDEGLALAHALSLERAGRLVEARASSARLDAVRSPAVAHLQARLALATGDGDAARMHYEALLNRHPADIHARLGLVRALRWLGDWSRALGHLETASKQDRFDPILLQERVSIELELGRVTGAARPLRKLRRLTRDAAPSLPSIAEVQLAMGAPSAALKALSGQEPPLLTARIRLARRELPQARAALARASTNPESMEIGAQIDLFEGQLDQGRQRIGSALAVPVSTAQRARLLHLLGEVEDRAERPAAAAAAWRAANYTWGPPGTARAQRKSFVEIARSMDRELLAWLPHRVAGGEGVVVVAGAPGSGVRVCSSLLAADPAVQLRVPSVPLAELARTLEHDSGKPWMEALHRLRPSDLDRLAARYLGKGAQGPMLLDGDVDAIPYLGLLQILLPQAKVVLVERDPADQLLSLWRRPYSRPDRSWSRSPTAARRWMHAHMQLQSHWRQELRIVSSSVRFEDLVRTPDVALGSVREALGLHQPLPLDPHHCVRPLSMTGPNLDDSRLLRGAIYADWIGQP